MRDEAKDILYKLKSLSTDELVDVFEEASAILEFRDLTRKQLERIKRIAEDILEYDIQ